MLDTMSISFFFVIFYTAGSAYRILQYIYDFM